MTARILPFRRHELPDPPMAACVQVVQDSVMLIVGEPTDRGGQRELWFSAEAAVAIGEAMVAYGKDVLTRKEGTR